MNWSLIIRWYKKIKIIAIIMMFIIKYSINFAKINFDIEFFDSELISRRTIYNALFSSFRFYISFINIWFVSFNSFISSLKWSICLNRSFLSVNNLSFHCDISWFSFFNNWFSCNKISYFTFRFSPPVSIIWYWFIFKNIKISVGALTLTDTII